jgi:hypothetical protein
MWQELYQTGFGRESIEILDHEFSAEQAGLA